MIEGLVAFIAGIFIGIAGAIPIGPVNLLVIRATLQRGAATGLACGLGAVVGDGIFALAAAFGLREVFDLVQRHAFLLQLAGGTLLLIVGFRLARSHLNPDALQNPGKRVRALSSFFLTIGNPAALMGMFAMFAALGAAGDIVSTRVQAFSAVAGVMAGSLLWWMLLSSLVARLHGRLNAAALDRITFWSGVAIAAFGVALLARAAVA